MVQVGFTKDEMPDPDFKDIKETLEEQMKRIKDEKPEQDVIQDIDYWLNIQNERG